MLTKIDPRRETVVALFADLITDGTEPETLADELDDIMWRYAEYMLKDRTLQGNAQNANAIYWLKELRDILNAKEKV